MSECRACKVVGPPRNTERYEIVQDGTMKMSDCGQSFGGQSSAPAGGLPDGSPVLAPEWLADQRQAGAASVARETA